MSQTANFTYQSINGLYCTPVTVKFTQISTGNPIGYIWNFGNNKNSNSANPSVTYNKPGTYTVKLIVVYPENTAEVSKTIVINSSISASISYDKSNLCKPDVINFSAASNGNIGSYDWDFGDGSPIISTASQDISHFYSTYGKFQVILTAKDISGCTSSTTLTIIVQKPSIVAAVSDFEGCIPANTNFNANVSVLPNDSVNSYMWNFGDGSPAVFTSVNNTSHTYNVPGAFVPGLVVTTKDGCTNTYNFDSVAFGIPPTNLITYPKKNVICGSEIAVFVAKATNANSYTWQVGINIINATDTFIEYKYTFLGPKKIIVTPSYNGCPGTPDSFRINVIGVISNFTYSNKCADKKTFSFQNKSKGNLSSVIWDFGDGSPQENTLDVVHSFPGTGTYVTTLTVSDNITGCSDIYSQKIYTANPLLINLDKSVCRKSTTTFTVLNKYANILSRYTWYVVGKKIGPATSSFINVKADSFGIFDNFVVINNGNQYCRDTLQLNNKILVKGPVVNFTSPDSVCLTSTLNVINNSKPYVPADSIMVWDWNFGDGSAHESTFQPLPHRYLNPGNYSVKLAASDKTGCKGVFVKTIIVTEGAFIYTLPRVDTLCLGQSKTLIAYQSGSVLWSPASLVSCKTCDTVLANPAQTTTFYATSTNEFACSAKDSILVKVYSPFTATAPVSDFYLCINDNVQLNVGPPFYKVMWAPATGLSNPNVYSPIASPSKTTTYTATLTDSVGCFSSSDDIIVHINTQPAVDAGPNKIYPYNTTFTLAPVYSSNIISYLWTPSTQLNCTNCASPAGVAIHTESYTISVTSDSGCVAKDEITIFIECKDSNLLMPGAFTPNNDRLNDVYYPLARGIKSIINFSIYNRMGQLVFQNKNFPPNNKSFGWDGTFKGKTNTSAVYVYIIEALCESGERLNNKGSFLLAR